MGPFYFALIQENPTLAGAGKHPTREFAFGTFFDSFLLIEHLPPQSPPNKKNIPQNQVSFSQSRWVSLANGAQHQSKPVEPIYFLATPPSKRGKMPRLFSGSPADPSAPSPRTAPARPRSSPRSAGRRGPGSPGAAGARGTRSRGPARPDQLAGLEAIQTGW